MTTFSWAALCNEADPTKPRIVTYRFGDRQFYEPFDKDFDRPYTRWAVGIGYWPIDDDSQVNQGRGPFIVGPWDGDKDGDWYG